MSKIVENTFRAVNIALVNEMAILGDRMGIDIWETHRRRVHQALRLHALLAGTRPRRPLHPGRPVLPHLARQGLRPGHRVRGAGRPHQHEHALLRRRRASLARSTRQGRRRQRDAQILLLGMAYKAQRRRPAREPVAQARGAAARGRRRRDATTTRTCRSRRAGHGFGGADPGAHRRRRLRGHRDPSPCGRPGPGRAPRAARRRPAQRGAADARRLARAAQRRPTSTCSRPRGPAARPVARGAVWIDLTNSPHVLFFRPILRRLDDAGRARSSSPRATSPRPSGCWSCTASRTRSSAATAAPASAARSPGLRAGRCALIRFGRATGASARPSATAPTTSRSRRGCCASTARSSTTSRAPPTMHRINFRLADKVMVPEVIPFERSPPLGPGRATLSAVPGHQGAGDPGRLRARPAASSRRSGSTPPDPSRCCGRRPP